MADRHDLDTARSPARGRDVNVWAVGRFGIALVMLCLVAVALLFGLFRYFESSCRRPPPEPGLNMDARTLPPAPAPAARPRCSTCSASAPPKTRS